MRTPVTALYFCQGRNTKPVSKNMQLRQIHSSENKNTFVGKFYTAVPNTVYKLKSSLKIGAGAYCCYGRIPSGDQHVAVFSVNYQRGCKLLAWTLTRQRILPVFRLNEHEDDANDFYLVYGETLLDCQQAIEDLTELKTEPY